MRLITLSASFLCLATTGCTDEADLGLDADPITCAESGPTADMAGTVRYNGATYHFDNASPSVTFDANGVVNGVSLWSSQNPDTQVGNTLRFYFSCGAPQLASYGVVSGGQQQLNCPLEVASTLAGSIEFMPAKSGTLIIDQTEGCLAGRFRVDVDSRDVNPTDGEGGAINGSGAVGGWFSIPFPGTR